VRLQKQPLRFNKVTFTYRASFLAKATVDALQRRRHVFTENKSELFMLSGQRMHAFSFGRNTHLYMISLSTCSPTPSMTRLYLGHIDIVPSRTTRSIFSFLRLDRNRLRRAHGFAQFARYAAFLAGGIAPQRMLPAESRADGTFFEGVVDGHFGLEEHFEGQGETAEELCQEKRLGRFIEHASEVTRGLSLGGGVLLGRKFALSCRDGGRKYKNIARVENETFPQLGMVAQEDAKRGWGLGHRQGFVGKDWPAGRMP
jgi:hypothetical protein